MDNRSPEMLKPTLIAGVVFGAVGALPFFNLINCACCALVVGCGFFAAYLYSAECRRQGAEFRPGMGALVGLIAGAFYAMAETLVSAVVQLTIGDIATRMVLEMMQNLPNIPPEASDQLEKFIEQSGTFTAFTLVMGFFMTLLLGAIFSTVGGLIGGAVFRVAPRSTAPPSPGTDLGTPPPSAPAV